MLEHNGAGSVEALVAELVEARSAFVVAVADIDPDLLLTPGLVGDWSARELIAHLGYWAGHATEALHHAEEGRMAEFDADVPSVDERNATVARVAAETDLRTVRLREEAAFEALLERLRNADAAWLSERGASDETVEQLIREDGPEHYREHTIDVRAWFDEGADEDEDLEE